MCLFLNRYQLLVRLLGLVNVPVQQLVSCFLAVRGLLYTEADVCALRALLTKHGLNSSMKAAQKFL